MIPIAKETPTVQDGIFSQSDWKTTFCLEQDCSFKEVIRLSRRLHKEIREKENAQKIAAEKAIRDAIKQSFNQPRRKVPRRKVDQKRKNAH